MVSKWRAGSKEIPELMQQVRALVSKIILFFFQKRDACLKEAMAEWWIGKLYLEELLSKKIGIESPDRGPGHWWHSDTFIFEPKRKEAKVDIDDSIIISPKNHNKQIEVTNTPMK